MFDVLRVHVEPDHALGLDVVHLCHLKSFLPAVRSLDHADDMVVARVDVLREVPRVDPPLHGNGAALSRWG